MRAVISGRCYQGLHYVVVRARAVRTSDRRIRPRAGAHSLLTLQHGGRWRPRHSHLARSSRAAGVRAVAGMHLAVAEVRVVLPLWVWPQRRSHRAAHSALPPIAPLVTRTLHYAAR